jgi:hypothetical protein
MPKRHKQASKPITENDDKEISESQKKHYSRMGYRPYLSNGGKIKWLNFEQHVYEKIKYAKKRSIFPFRRFPARKTRPHRYLRLVGKFVADNWVLLLVLFSVVLSLVYINQILFLISKI